jgi:hypothetical protein
LTALVEVKDALTVESNHAPASSKSFGHFFGIYADF